MCHLKWLLPPMFGQELWNQMSKCVLAHLLTIPKLRWVDSTRFAWPNYFAFALPGWCRKVLLRGSWLDHFSCRVAFRAPTGTVKLIFLACFFIFFIGKLGEAHWSTSIHICLYTISPCWLMHLSFFQGISKAGAGVSYGTGPTSGSDFLGFSIITPPKR